MKIKIALHGMDQRCESRMKTIFTMNFKDQCEVADINNADTVIFDMDDKNIEVSWSDFRMSYPEIPVIIMATEHVDLIGTAYVAKPARLAELLEAIKSSSKKQISSNLNTSLKTHNAAKALLKRSHQATYSNKANSDESFELFYNPEDFLQGNIIKAIDKSKELNKEIFIKCWKDQWLLLSPNTDYLLQNISDAQIKTYGLVPLGDELAYSEHSFSDNEISYMAKAPTSTVKVISIEEFLWAITIKTSRGRVPFGSSLDELYVLEHWPNLTRLRHIPNATRISAFWVGQAQSINNVINKLHIPFVDVSTFFSAAMSIGIMKPAQRNEDHMIEPDVITTDKKKHSLFASLINKVSKNMRRTPATKKENV